MLWVARELILLKTLLPKLNGEEDESSLKGAPKQGAAGKPLAAPSPGGALVGAGKQGAAGKPLAAPAPGGALMGAGKQGPVAGKPLAAPAPTGFKTAQPGSTSKAPAMGQAIGTRTPPRPTTAAPTKPPMGASKALPNALNKKK